VLVSGDALGGGHFLRRRFVNCSSALGIVAVVIGAWAFLSMLPGHALAAQTASLREAIERGLKALPPYPEYIHGQGGLADAVLEVGARKRIEEYDRWYGVAINYRGLAEVELLRARRLLNRGESDAAKEHVERSNGYVKQSHLANQAAITCYQAGVEQANLKAKAVYESSRAAFVFVSGAAGLGPFATVIADHVYTATDFAVNWKQSGLSHATKQAVIDVISQEIGKAILKEAGVVLPKDVKGARLTTNVRDLVKKLATDSEFSERIVRRVAQKTTEEVTSSMVSEYLSDVAAESADEATSQTAPPSPSQPRSSAAESSRLCFPLEGRIETRRAGRLERKWPGFGDEWRRHAKSGGKWKLHVGTDWPARSGEPVYAAQDGVVYDVRPCSSEEPKWGQSIVIDHGGQLSTTYMHLEPEPGIEKRARVTRGQRIGRVIDLGVETHLHFGVRETACDELSFRGALPEIRGNEDEDFYARTDPLFSERGKHHFVDPEGLQYQILSQPPEWQETSPVAACFIIDRSGSMALGMPWHLRTRRIDAAKQAAHLFADLLYPNDGTAIVAFSSSASPVLEFGPFDSGQAFRAAVDRLNPGGRTNIGDGIEKAVEQLTKPSAFRKVCLLLSDGCHNTGKGPEEVITGHSDFFAGGKCPIFTVGLGSGKEFNEDQLEAIATATGGQYIYGACPSYLSCHFAEILERDGRHNTLYCLTTKLINQGATALHKMSLNPPPVARFLTTWDGSKLDAALVAPSGTQISETTAAANADVHFSRGENYILYTVRKPAAGEWGMKVTGADVPKQGERYFVMVSGASPIETNVVDTPQIYPPGEFVKVRVAIGRRPNASGSVTTLSTAGTQVAAKITRPDGKQDTLILHDDGNHADGKAGDGIFGAAYRNTALEGDYEARISINGVIDRTITWGFAIDRKAGPEATGVGDGTLELPWQQVEVSVLGVTQRLKEVKRVRGLTLQHKASGQRRSISGEFVVFEFRVTNDSKGPLRLARSRGKAERFGETPTVLEASLGDEGIRFRHYASDARGKPLVPEDFAGYGLPGEPADGEQIEKGKTVPYSLVFRLPPGFKSDVKYLIETHYQAETGGRVQTVVPWAVLLGAPMPLRQR